MRALTIVALVSVGCSSNGLARQVEPMAIRWQAPLEIAAGGGQKGEWQQNESDFDYVDDPAVALDADGTAAVAWVDQALSDVLFQEYALDGKARLASPVNVSRSPRIFSWMPRVAIRGDDVYVLWQEIVSSGGSHGGETHFARSRDRGKTFTPWINLSRSKNGDGKGQINDSTWDNGSLDLALARDGTLLAAWSEFDGPLWISLSRDQGATFSDPVLVANEPGKPARAPALAFAPDGTAYLAWTVGKDEAADIRLATMKPGADKFGTPVIVRRTPHYSDAPKVAIDDRGTVHLAYAESDGGPFGRFHVTYARSSDGGRTFDTSRELSRATGTESAAFPMLALDRSAVVVSWEVYAKPGERPRGLAITYSLDGGATFAAPAPIEHSTDPAGGWNGSQQGKLMRKLVIRDGRIAVVNSALAPGKGSRVWLVRGELATR